MSDVERRLVSPLISAQSIVDVTLGSKRYREHAATFVQHTDEILVTVMPRLPSEIDMFIVKPANCPLPDKKFLVRRRIVERFCRLAKCNNLPGWENIQVDQARIDKLPEHGVPSDLPGMIVPDAKGNQMSHGPEFNVQGETRF